MRRRRAVIHQFIPAKRLRAHGDVAHGQTVAGYEVPVFQMIVEHRPELYAVLDCRIYFIHIPVRRLGAHQTPKYRKHECCDRCQLPIHPGVGGGA